MKNKLELLRLVASVFKGITVDAFNERFGACSADEIRFYAEEQKRLMQKYLVTDKGCVRL